MVYIILAIVGLYLFSKKSTTPMPVTVLANQGGTSTPIPTATIPPFYQQNNAATESVPITTQGFHNPPDSLVIPVEHNNIKLASETNPFTTSTTSNPIPIFSIAPNEPTSYYEEQVTALANNGVGPYANTVVEYGYNPPFGNAKLGFVVTNNSPVSVPPRQAPTYQGDAALIAPNPPPQAKLETILPMIADSITKVAYAPNVPVSLRRQVLLD